MNGKEIKKVLKSGGKVFGTLVEGISNSKQLDWYIQQTGMDFVFIDNEHDPLDRAQTSCICSIFSKAGIAPIVRIPKPDSYFASMALDGGAHGIMVPYVETADDAWSTVAAVKYRPLKGKYLLELRNSGKFPSIETESYVNRLNENGIVVIMIESIEGINKLDEILAVPGIDVILIGPNDLSVSLGVPDMYEHPIFMDAVQKILDTCLKARVGFGVHLNTPELHRNWIERGQNFTVYASDTYVAFKYLKEGIADLRGV